MRNGFVAPILDRAAPTGAESPPHVLRSWRSPTFEPAQQGPPEAARPRSILESSVRCDRHVRRPLPLDRDAYRAEDPPAPHGAGRMPPDGLPRGKSPVSYTHLTLPTIYS